ncbi:MAG: hypothetical protein ACLPYY_04430 [Acidimicrobiales bacterium]
MSRQPPPGGIKPGDFDKAIADVWAVCRKYGVLLTAVDYAIDEKIPGLDWWLPLSTLFGQRGPGDIPPEASVMSER